MTAPNDAPAASTASTGGAAPLIGSLLARVVVPLWVLMGAGFKLADGVPNKLPRSLLEFGQQNMHKIGLDLDIYLGFFIAVELVFVGVMFFVPRLARGAAIIMMGSFCAVLVLELLRGNFSDCGCFGNTITMPPWLMLMIDGAFLVGLIILPTRVSVGSAKTSGWSWPAAGAWALTSLILVGVVTQERRADAGGEIIVEDEGDTPREVVNGARDGIDESDAMNGAGDDAESPTAPARPETTASDAPAKADGAPRHVRKRPPGDYFYIPGEAKTLTGQWFFETELASFVPRWPEGMNEGRWYVVFYGPTCDHCSEVFQKHFAQGSPVPTVKVAIPDENGMPRSGTYPMPCPGCEEAALPSGLAWVLGTPVVFAIEDGRIICATEGETVDDPQCLIWH